MTVRVCTEMDLQSERSGAPPWIGVVARFAWPGALVAISAMAFGYLRDQRPPSGSDVRVEHAGATVVRELRTLSRLETSSIRVEKIIELKDHQKLLHGLVDADDTLLFVAAGEVVLGVDLSKAVASDPTSDVATIELPPPEVLSTRFDEAHSYVHSRTTDMLARRNEGLEATARQEALAAFAVAGRDHDALEGAKSRAEGQLRTLAKAWGAKDLVVTWKVPTGPSGEVASQ